MNIILLIISVVLFLMASLVGFGWATINNIDGFVMLGLAAFAASFLPWPR